MVCGPQQRSVATHDFFGCAKVIVENLAQLAVFQPCHRAEAVRLEEPVNGAGAAARLSYLARNDVAVPDEGHGGVLAALRNPRRPKGSQACARRRRRGSGPRSFGPARSN